MQQGGGGHRGGRPKQPDKDKGAEKALAPTKRTNSKGGTRCFNCGREDHWVDKCPLLTDEHRGDLMAQVKELNDNDNKSGDSDSDGVSMFVVRRKTKRETLDPLKVYLVSCSTYHQFVNKEYVDNIRGAERKLRGQCNCGTPTISQEGDHGDLCVWFNPVGLANIYSVPRLDEDGYVVSYHTHGEWVVTKANGEEVTFKHDTGGCVRMPFIDLRYSESAVSMAQTLQGKFEGFPDREVRDD